MRAQGAGNLLDNRDRAVLECLESPVTLGGFPFRRQREVAGGERRRVHVLPLPLPLAVPLLPVAEWRDLFSGCLYGSVGGNVGGNRW